MCKLKENIRKLRLNAFISFLLILSPVLFIVIIIGHILTNFLRLFKTRKDISGRLALITGGGSGLGRCIAQRLAQNGCNIAIVDINVLAMEETVEIIKNIRNDIVVKSYKVDVSNLDEVKSLAVLLKEDFKTSVHLLVNNAGIFGEMGKDIFMPNDDIQKMIEVNLLSQFWMLMTFLDQMRINKYGHIIAISSVSALLPKVGLSYPATKFGIRGLMKSLEWRLNKCKLDFIKTTTVYPYFLNTCPEVVNNHQPYIDKFYPTVDGMKAAKIIVNGIRKDETEIIIPRVFGRIYWLLNLLPLSWQKTLGFY